MFNVLLIGGPCAGQTHNLAMLVNMLTVSDNGERYVYRLCKLQTLTKEFHVGVAADVDCPLEHLMCEYKKWMDFKNGKN